MLNRVNLLVSIDDKRKHQFKEIVDELKKCGMSVEQTLETLGVITGSMDHYKIDQIRKIEGISSVEEERVFQIPPPDSKIQ